MDVEALVTALQRAVGGEDGGALAAGLRHPRNFSTVQRVLEANGDPAIKLALLESLNKALTAALPPVKEGVALRDEEERRITIEYVRTLLAYLPGYARASGSPQPVYLANSACNLYGQQIKSLLLCRQDVASPLAALRSQTLDESAQLWDAQILLKLLHYVLLNLTGTPTTYGYFEFRQLISTFEDVALAAFLDQTAFVLKRIGEVLRARRDEEALRAALLGLRVLNQLLCFPFGLSYYEYCADQVGEEISLAIYPDMYAGMMEDRELIELLLQIFIGALSPALSLEVLRALNRMAASRLSLFSDEAEKAWHKKEFVRFFALLVEHSPRGDRAFDSELLDYGLRCLFVFGFRYIEDQSDLLVGWRLSWQELGARVVHGSKNLADPVLTKYLEYLKKCVANGGRPNEQPSQFLVAYCEHFFRHFAHIDFFPREFVAARSFTRSVQKRFETMRAVYFNAGQSGPTALAQAIEWLLAEPTNGEAAANAFAARLSHFLLAFTCLGVKTEYRVEYFSDDSDRPSPATAGELCLRCFELLARAHTLGGALRADMRRVLEMSILFFLDQFLAEVRKTISWNAELGRLEASDELFQPLCRAGVFRDFGQFFDSLITKIFSNFAFKDATLSSYSAAVLRAAVERTRKAVESPRNTELLAGVAERLFGVVGALSTDPKEIKLRTELMRLLATIYLDDYLDDYIANAQMLLGRLRVLDSVDGALDVGRLLGDAIGVFAAVAHRKIFVVVCRIFYPQLQGWLQAAGPALMASQSQVLALIDFYSVLLDQLLTYDSGPAHEVVVQIITDSCAFIGLMAREVNANLRSLAGAQLTAFVAEYKKLVKRLLSCFGKLLKYAGVSFLVLHVFGNQIFVDFAENVVGFASLLTETVLAHFLQLRDELIGLLNELGPIVAHLSVAALPAASVREYLNAVFFYFTFTHEQMLFASDSRTLSDETALSNTQAILYTLLNELGDTARINPERAECVGRALAETAPAATDFAARAVLFALEFACSLNAVNLFADLLFALLTGYERQAMFAGLVQRVAAANPSIGAAAVQRCFEGVRAALGANPRPRAREAFQQSFAAFVAELRRERKAAV